MLTHATPMAPLPFSSRHRIPPLRIHRPRDIGAAVSLLRDGALALAGGTDLIDRLKCGLIARELVAIDLLPGLRALSWDGADLRIGAAITHHELANSELAIPSLRKTWGAIANIRIRSCGTIGGNLMAGVATYEAAAILAAAGAVARIIGVDGTVRDIPVAQIFGESGLLVDVTIPDARNLSIAADRSFREYLVVVRASRPNEPDRFAIGGLGPTPILLRADETRDFRHHGPDAAFINGLVATLTRRLQRD